MGEKKNMVLELAAKGVSRAEIARQAKCSTPFVTQTLGAVRKYTRKAPKVELCPGCEDPTCKTSGCLGA